MYLRKFVFARHIFVLTQSLQLQSLLLAKERVVLNFLVFRTSSIYPIGFMWPGFNDQVHEFVSSLDVTHRRQRIGGARRPGWLGHLSFRVRTAAQCSVLLALSFRSYSVTRKLTVLNSVMSLVIRWNYQVQLTLNEFYCCCVDSPLPNRGQQSCVHGTWLEVTGLITDTTGHPEGSKPELVTTSEIEICSYIY